MCSPNAQCVRTQYGPRCQCFEDYVGNGTHCNRVYVHDGGFLLLNQGMATLRVPFQTTARDSGRPIHVSYYQTAIGIDIDCAEGRVYWSDFSGRAIKSSNYDGTAMKVILNTEIDSPEGVSVDWDSRLLYWADSTRKTVEVVNIDNPTLRTTIARQGLVNPRGIAVHPGRGKVFWSDWNRSAPKLEWANMDGTGRQVFLQGESVQLPNALTINWETDELCYADAGTKTIECVNIDTKAIRRVVGDLAYPFGLAISDKHFYWTDWETKAIESLTKTTETREAQISVSLGGSGKLYHIVAVPKRCPSIRSACGAGASCQPNHLCLPNPKSGYSCVCGNSKVCNAVEL